MKNKTFKKSLSVIMAVLMLMSSWVFFPGMVIFEAEAAETVGVTTSFTLSPNGNRGNDGTWTRLALTGESSAAGTSVVLFRFSNEELQRLADKDEVNLQFYAYSCNNRLSHNNVGVTVNADIYYIAQNADFVNNQGTSANVTDTGNSVLGTDYTYENAQNSAKSYFGLSDANFVGSFEQPTINGQDNASLRTGDANYMYPVTDIVKEKAAAGEDLSFIVMLRQGYSCSGDRGWSDIYIDSDSIALSDGNIMLDQLKSMIEAYEGYFEDGTFYTNLQNNYKAYNDAKRYYDAVKYGGVEFDTATAQSYMSAIDTAIANTGDNPTYVDYLNANITSRDGSSVSAAYRKNVIWYPWDFSWDITSNNARPVIQDTYFYFTMPNTIVGITNDSETTFPLHSFFWTTTGSRYVRYVIAGSGTISSGVVGSSDFATMAPWKISDDNNTHTTSGLAPGTDGFGGWVFEKNYRTDVSLKNAESNSGNFSYSQDKVYQISSYAQINKSSIGVDASNTYKKVDQGFTFATANMANQGGSYKSDYGNHYASNYSNYGGALHVVYMDTYKKNYENWKTLIPAISYKDYNGFVYSNATNVTGYLDEASGLNLNLGLTEANRVGSIDSTVTVWATNVNRGANSLVNAKAAGTTRVTNKYLDLIDAISASDSTYSAGNTKYTTESWNTFAAAYEAAQAHMASLDPSGSNVQYSSDATAIGNLATDLNNARNALTVRTYDITFDNLIDFRDWNTTSASNAVISAVTAGGFTLTSNAGVGEGTSSSPFFAVQPGKQYTVDIDIEGEAWDVYIFFCDENGSWIDFADGPTNRYSATTTWGSTFTAPNNPNVVKAQIRVDANGSNNSVTFSNIRVYEKGTVVDGVSYVEAKTYSHGDPLGAKLSVPTKEGYTFDGWWVDSINTNGVKDAGEQVTDGEGNVVTDLQNFGITQDWVLYSEWTINKYTVTWKNEDGTVLETDTNVEYGATPFYDGATPTKAADAQYTYTFKGWSPTVSAVTGDVTYTATYDKTANSVTVTWKFVDGTEKTETYTYGTTPTAPANTAAYNDANGHHTYSWPTLGAVTGDVTYEETKNTAGHTFDQQTATDTYKVSDASCTAKAVYYYSCSCGAKGTATFEYGELAAHTPGAAATCTAPQTCTVCGTVLNAQLAHTYDREVVTDTYKKNDASCTAKAVYYYSCSCGAKGTTTFEYGEKLAHTLGEWITDKEPTCITAGSKHKECANCDYTETEQIPATGVHKYGEWSQFNNGTTHRRTCTADTNCTAYEEEAHTFNGTAKKLDGENYHQYKCEKCNAYGVGTALNAKEACFGEGITFTPIDANDIQHKETCKCGREQNDGHDWEGWVADPANTADNQGTMSNTCKECGYKKTSACTYEVTAEKAATCTEDGYKTWDCKDCDNGYTEILKAPGHTYGEWIAEKPATCVATGTKGHYECSVCKKYFDENKAEITDLTLAVDTDNHDLVSHEAKAPTCTEIGWDAYETCQREGCDYTTYVEKAALNHDWADATYEWTEAEGEWTCTAERVCNRDKCGYTETANAEITSAVKTPATCTVKGTTTYTATFDKDWAEAQTKDVQDIPVIAHTYESVVTDPTCTEKGYTTHTCTVCGDSYVDTYVDALDHDWADVTYTWAEAEGEWTCTAERVCNRDKCGHTETATAEITSAVKTPATCTVKGTTTYTATFDKDWAEAQTKDVQDIPVIAHTYESVVTKPTCTEKGYTTHTCTVCGHSYKDTYVDALNHDWADTTYEWTEAEGEWTCTAERVCKRDKCGHIETATAKITSAEKTPATCTVKGTTTYTATFEEDWATEQTKDVQDIPVIDHDFAESFTVDSKASCTETGSKSKHCSRCDAKTEITVIPIREHVFEDTTVAKAATCLEAGTMNQKCKNAETDEYKACDATTTREIPALGHKFGETVTANAATCVKDGNHAYKQCETCKLYFAENAENNSEDGKNDTSSFVIGIDSTNHENKTEHKAISETCTSVGYTVGVFCEDCDTWISGHTEIPAIGHKNKVHHKKVDETCISEGTVEYWSCPDCGKNFSDEECTIEATNLKIPVDASKHTRLVKTDRKAATCTEDGNIEYWTCDGCKKIYSDENANTEIKAEDTVLNAINHKWGDWTYDADGKHKRVCTNDEKHTETEACADSETDTDCICDKCGNLVQHSYGDATCDKPATCTVCGAETGGPLGHSFTNYVSNSDATCTEDGTKTAKCDRCDATDTVKDEGSAKGHKDENKDHACDNGCDVYQGEHEDTNKDHKCEYGCSVAIGTCEDADKDHACDYGCDKVYGEHVDTDKDHNCDYGCKETIGTCEDADKDHACDYGCDKVYGEHVDADKDHNCDYGCKETIGTCEDADKDHACDYGCDKVYGEHVDADKDHNCDYGCKETIGTCEDADKDHACDYGCDKVYGEHIDTDKDHNCDYGCKETIGTCEDADKDHDCDYGCDKVYGEHKDTNNDHKCEYGCSVTIGTCEDADKDHACDYGCDKVYGEHVDADKDHNCDYGCKETIGTCEDADKDHACDYGCDKYFGEHEDTNKDHKCEYGCSVAIGECADSADDKDHVCDYGCGKVLEDCIESEWIIETPATCETAGARYKICKICGTELQREIIPAINHNYDTTKSEANLTRPVYNEETGEWSQGYYTYTCKNDVKHTTVEEVTRATYTAYETALENLNSLLETDITDEAEAAIREAIEDNKIADNLIESEQKIIDEATENLVKAFEDNNSSLNTYTVTFKIDGSDDVVVTVISGQDATAPTGVTKAYDENNHYKFTGWDGEFTNVTADITVTAVFEAIAHSYTHTDKDDTYHTDKCDCGYTKYVEHTETSAVTTKASCYAAGVRTYTCSDCGGTRTEAIAKREHNIVDTTVAVAPTCSTTGTMNQKCDHAGSDEYEACDYTTTRVMDKVADAHKAEADYTVMQKATCEADGYKAILCEYCDAELSKETIAKREHKYEDNGVKTAATCSAEGVMNTICTNAETETHVACSHESTRVIEIDPNAHSWGEWTQTKAPTCSAKGEKKRVCKYNDQHTDTREVDIVSDAHDWAEATYSFAEDGKSCTAERVCKNDANHTETATATITSAEKTPATCTVKGWTTYTATFTETWATEQTKDVQDIIEDASNHAGETYTKDENIVAGTCKTEKTWNEVTYCSDCGAKLKTVAKTGDKDANNHAGLKQGEAKEKTCTEDGWEAYEYCTECDYTTKVVIPAGHVIKQGEAKEKTCTEDGWEAYEYCTECDYTTKVVIPAGHVIKQGEAKEKTCTEDGWEAYEYCTECDYTTKVVIPAGHVIKQGEAKEKTCTEDGWEAYEYCTECDYTTKVVIPAGHIIKQGEAKEKTCTEDGWEAYEYCTECDYTTKVVIPAGHIIKQVEEKAPTCTEDGYKAYEYCTECDYTTYEAVPAEGHTEATRTENHTSSSCTSAGSYDVVTYCTVCGTVLDRETVTTSAGQHSWAEEGIILPEEAPTCITEGIRRHYCIYDCGWYKEVILPKTDHKYDEGTVVAPTCTNEGYTVYHCTVDGCKASVDKDFVPALDHDYITAVTAPTCDAQGYTTYTCKVCTDTFVSDFVKANGHADSNADGNCDHCKTNIIGACKCGCHSTNWFIRIIYMIVRFIWKLFKLNPVCHCGLAHY